MVSWISNVDRHSSVCQFYIYIYIHTCENEQACLVYMDIAIYKLMFPTLKHTHDAFHHKSINRYTYSRKKHQHTVINVDESLLARAKYLIQFT